MELHVSREHKPRFLMVDREERVAELGTRFLHSLEKQRNKYAPLTLERYAHRLTAFLDFIEKDTPGELNIDDAIKVLGLDDADNFYAALDDEGLKPGTIRDYEVPTKKFANWLTTADAGRVHDISIYDGVSWRTSKSQTAVPKFILKDTVIVLLKRMHIEEHRLAGHFIYDTGARVSEVERVKKADLPNPDHYPAGVDYLPLLLRGSKGRGGDIKERYTVISRPVLARINRYHNSFEYKSNHRWSPEDKPLLLNSYGQPLKKKAIQKAIADAKARSDIVQRVASHILRHGMAASVLSSRMGNSMLDNLIMLQKMLGHSQLSTTEIYTSIPVTTLHQIVEANGKLGRDRIHDAEDIYQQTYLPKRLTAANRSGPKRQKPRAD